MCDCNKDKLIKGVAFDIISMITIWGLVNIVNPDDLSAYIYMSTYKLYVYSPKYLRIAAMGASGFILSKYF